MATKNNYFSAFGTKEQLKAQYKKLAFKLHPLKTGNPAPFNEMIKEYESHLSDLLHFEFRNISRIDSELQIDKEMRDILNKIIHLQGIIINFVGSWLWLSGDTYQVKETIKAAGFKFSGKKKAWYYIFSKKYGNQIS